MLRLEGWEERFTLNDLEVGEESGLEDGLTESRTFGNLSHQELDDNR